MIVPVQLGARTALRNFGIAAAAAVGLSLAGLAAVQTVRIEGLKIWPVEIEGLKDKAGRLAGERDKAKAERDSEAAAHRATKVAYRIAQDQAAKREAERLARVTTEQQEITVAVSQNYRERLAAARNAAERLRGQAVRARADAGRSSGAGDVSSLPDAARRTDQAAGNHRLSDDQLKRDLTATEQALQLDALIDWIQSQQKVDLNR